MTSFVRRLTSVAMVFALSGSPAVLVVCMPLCLDSPMAAASATGGGTSPGHGGHGAVAESADASPRAHHGTAASTQPTAGEANAWPPAPSDARLVEGCDGCCGAGPAGFGAGLSVARIDGKTLAPAATIAVATFHPSAGSLAAASPSPPVPPPSPTRARLVLRI